MVQVIGFLKFLSEEKLKIKEQNFSSSQYLKKKKKKSKNFSNILRQINF